jgi:beta-mannosidase
VSELSSQVYLQVPLSDLGGKEGADAARQVVVAELVVEGKSVSRNLIYLVPTKQVQLPAANIKTELAQAADGYHLRLTSPVLARSVYVTFGAASPELSDNYFDLLPGETVDVVVKSQEPLDQLKATMRVVSLADAFAPESIPK